MDKKDLSAARKKLQEYKQNKKGPSPITVGVTAGTGGPSTFTEVDETSPRNSVADALTGQSNSPLPHTHPLLPPPPLDNVPNFLNNLGQEQSLDLDVRKEEDVKVINVDESQGQSQDHREESPASLFSDFGKTLEEFSVTPTKPTVSQEFAPVNFFQSTPLAHNFDVNSPSATNSDQPLYEPQDFIYHNPIPPEVPASAMSVFPGSESAEQSPPLFFNITGDTITPVQQRQNNFRTPTTMPYAPPSVAFANYSGHDGEGTDGFNHFSPPPSLPMLDARNFRPIPELGSKIEEDPIVISDQQIAEMRMLEKFKATQEALEIQLQELRRENQHLVGQLDIRQSQLESCESSIQDLRRQRDSVREESKKMMQPLNVKINNLYEENQRILKNSNDVGMELRTKLQEKSKQHEDMEQAFIIVTKSKMDLAAELDQEKEKTKDLEATLNKKDQDIKELRELVLKLEDKIKSEQQKDTIIHQLEDQVRHYHVQSDTLQRELRRANNKMERWALGITNKASEENPDNPSETLTEEPSHTHHDHEHDHETCDGHDSHHHHDHEHAHDHSGHSHSHPDHDHDSHTHTDHDHCNGHDHEHDHHQHHDNLEGQQIIDGHPPKKRNELEDLKKRLHHLEWENATFRSDVEKLVVEARDKKQLEDKYNKVSEDCQKFKDECKHLEHLVAQLQGENDTIGDYIALYQSQRLALKETAKEKDVQLVQLGKERQALLRKMDELTQLLKILKGSVPAGDQKIMGAQEDNQEHQCPHHILQSSDGINPELQGRIKNLLSEIGSSNLLENFHPCAVCSGRLMNV